jgi:2'-5' RNA ligase
MKKRLFFALLLSSGLLKKIAFLEERIEEKTKRKFPWLPIKNLHLTIIFLGYLNYEDYLKLKNVFKNFNYRKRIEIKIKKIDYGPPGRKRMIWLYLEKNQDLENLKKSIEEKLQEEKISYHYEEREFLPHINLARLKNIKDLPEIKEELNWQVVFNELVLYESILKPSGAEYEKLLKLALNSHL